MSDPLDEREEKGPSVGRFFSIIGTALIIVSAGNLLIIGFDAFLEPSPSDKFDFALLLVIGAVLIIFSILSLAQNHIKFQVNEVVFAIFTLIIIVFSVFIAPGKAMPASALFGTAISLSYTDWVQWFNAFAICGSLIVLIAKRPNFGPEANRRIYQAVGGWIATIMSIIILLLGLYMVYGFDIANYAGNGRYPGGKEDFFDAFISVISPTTSNAMMFWFNIYHLEQYPGMQNYIPGLPNFVWSVGWTVMIGAGIIFAAAVLRNRISLKLASGVLLAGVVVSLVGLSQFDLSWKNLDGAMRKFYVVDMNPPWYDVYEQQLKLRDPGLFLFGVVLILIVLVALFFIIYASFSAKPIDKWMMRRDRYIAAAEVATKEGKLESAMRYLELAAEWSSKVDEEDKAVELLTKVRQIEKKAIQMKKAKAAEDAKKKMKDEDKDKKATEKKYKEVSEKEEAGTKKSEHVAKQEGAGEGKPPTGKTPK